MALHTPDTATDHSFNLAELCGGFVARVVAEAREVAARKNPGADIPDVDWDAIWRAGEGVPTLDRAVGQVVAAAFVAAREIAGEGGGSTENRPWPGMLSIPARVALPELTAGSLQDPITEQVTIAPAIGAPFVSGPPTEEIRITRPVVPKVVVSPPRTKLRPLTVAAVTPNMVTHDDSLLPPRWATVFTWVRNVGAVILLFVAWQLWGTSIGEHHDQSALRSQFEAAVHAHHGAPTPGKGAVTPLLPANAAVEVPAEGSAIAHLSIPAIGVDQYVVSGTATADLDKGPGHYTGTAMPGQEGNVVIAGHRTTHGAPFNRLGDVVVGDKIILTTLSGANLTYVVSQAPTPVSPSDVAILNDFGDNRVTLTTCNPEFSATQRLIVVAELAQNGPAPVALPRGLTKPIEYHVVNSATASWNWGLLPIVLLEGGLLVALGLVVRRTKGWYTRFGQWLILTPLWVAGLYLIFQSLSNFLPASI